MIRFRYLGSMAFLSAISVSSIQFFFSVSSFSLPETVILKAVPGRTQHIGNPQTSCTGNIMPCHTRTGEAPFFPVIPCLFSSFLLYHGVFSLFCHSMA